jgi:hypothetical protein
MSEWSWLESTKRLQIESFNTDPSALEGAQRADYTIWNVLAAVDELHEFLQCIAWKPWILPELRGHVSDRVAAVRELVDCAHFIGNLLVMLNVTDEEWERLYAEKQAINAKRQRDGYTGAKCRCGRSTDQLGDTTIDPDGVVSCNGCGGKVERA